MASTEESCPGGAALHPRLVVSPSKAFGHLFTKIRDANTKPADFASTAKRAMRLLAEDAIAELPTRSVEVETPCGPAAGVHVDADENLCAVSIIRAGDSLLESVRECLPSVSVGKILIQRNEDSEEKEPKLFYSKMPPRVADMNILLCDPMLATGGSAKMAIETLVSKHNVKPERIIFANVICCPEGLGAMAEAYPEVKIVTACVDKKLNEEKYIVPGLGDFGDRFFGTV